MAIQSAKGNNPERHYRFIVEFGLHTFTLKPNAHTGQTLSDFPVSMQYADSRETRIFCFDRHAHSFNLPDIVMNIGRMSCYHTGKGNFFVIEVLGKDDVPIEYEVYFNVAREKDGILKLFVESAYVRDNKHASSQPKKKKINFFVIAYNTFQGKQIKIPPG